MLPTHMDAPCLKRISDSVHTSPRLIDARKHVFDVCYDDEEALTFQDLGAIEMLLLL